MKEITYLPVGVVHSSFKSGVGMPIQSCFADGSKGTVEVYKEYMDGLLGLNEFSHIILIYHFHLNTSYKLITKPFALDKDLGIFAIRSPVRPNAIGMSIVRLEKVEDNIIYINDVDIIDGTPVLDIKPYVAKFDIRTNTNDGWTKGNIEKRERQISDDRFANLRNT